MSRDASISLTFAGDERTFRLGYDNLLALQDACGSGYLQIFYRLSEKSARVEDVRETLRIGLIGAGVDAKIAKRLVEENLFPLAEPQIIATLVLGAAIAGDPNEQVGKPEAAVDQTEAVIAFPLPPSTTSPAEPDDRSMSASA